MAQNTTNNRKKSPFTLKQRAAFAFATIPFDGDGVKPLRDDALHGRVSRFSNCNEPMKRIYDEIASKKSAPIINQ